jgi:hypothetical protein
MIYARAGGVTARESCALFQVDLGSGKSCSKIAWTAGIASANTPREAFSGVSASKPRDPTTKYPSNVVPIVTGISGPEYARALGRLLGRRPRQWLGGVAAHPDTSPWVKFFFPFRHE